MGAGTCGNGLGWEQPCGWWIFSGLGDLAKRSSPDGGVWPLKFFCLLSEVTTPKEVLCRRPIIGTGTTFVSIRTTCISVSPLESARGTEAIRCHS